MKNEQSKKWDSSTLGGLNKAAKELQKDDIEVLRDLAKVSQSEFKEKMKKLSSQTRANHAFNIIEYQGSSESRLNNTLRLKVLNRPDPGPSADAGSQVIPSRVVLQILFDEWTIPNLIKQVSDKVLPPLTDTPESREKDGQKLTAFVKNLKEKAHKKNLDPDTLCEIHREKSDKSVEKIPLSQYDFDPEEGDSDYAVLTKKGKLLLLEILGYTQPQTKKEK